MRKLRYFVTEAAPADKLLIENTKGPQPTREQKRNNKRFVSTQKCWAINKDDDDFEKAERKKWHKDDPTKWCAVM